MVPGLSFPGPSFLARRRWARRPWVGSGVGVGVGVGVGRVGIRGGGRVADGPLVMCTGYIASAPHHWPAGDTGARWRRGGSPFSAPWSLVRRSRGSCPWSGPALALALAWAWAGWAFGVVVASPMGRW
ncbi:hypothetical protein GCM10009590_15590 [Brachybacterium alimentarium]